jgi:RNAse (barnase) inhibitor barstar
LPQTSEMEKYPDIKNGQFTVQFLDRNTGIVLDHDFIHYNSNTNQKVYSIHDSLKKALEYIEKRRTTINQENYNVGYFIRNKNEKTVLHTDNLSKTHPGERKTIIINGDNFSDTEGFHNEIDNVLTSELDWKTGHNLNAFNDLLRGGFCVHEYEEPIQLVWTNSNKSKTELTDLWDNKTLYQSIVEIIKDHGHIEFIEK